MGEYLHVFFEADADSFHRGYEDACGCFIGLLQLNHNGVIADAFQRDCRVDLSFPAVPLHFMLQSVEDSHHNLVGHSPYRVVLYRILADLNLFDAKPLLELIDAVHDLLLEVLWAFNHNSVCFHFYYYSDFR